MTPEALAEVERVRLQHGDEAAAVVARFIDGDITTRRTVRDRKVGRKPKTVAIPVTRPKDTNDHWRNWDFSLHKGDNR